jgi:hypothetical protein
MAASEEQWEYCRFEDVLGRGFVPAKLVFFTIDGEKTETFSAGEETQRTEVARRVAQLGDEGWEMVGTGISGQGSHAIYFKRRKH